MMPPESFSEVLVCCHLMFHRPTQVIWPNPASMMWRKHALPTIVDVTIKPHGKVSGHIILLLRGQKNGGQFILPQSTLLSVFLHPSPMQNILALIYDVWKFHPFMTSGISFIFILHLVPLD